MDEATLFIGLYGKCIDYMARVPHHRLKIPPKRVWCRSRDRCLIFNPFNISGGMRWGGS